jgi:hypothetical protein
MSTTGVAYDSEPEGQVLTDGCAMIELDDDSQAKRDSYVKKICDIGRCSFAGHIDADGLTVQTSFSDCYRAGIGLQDDFNTDEEFVFPILY